MSFFPSLPEDAGVRHILKLNPAAGRALIELHTAVLRTDTRLTARDKELIAAYVSGLNACRYCFGVHRETAAAFGVDPELLETLLNDFDRAPLALELKVLLAYARRLTIEPAKTTARDAEAVFAAGWSERDVHDAVLTVCLFNFMNRLLEGHGVKGSREIFAERGLALKEQGYAPLLRMLDDAPAAAPDTPPR
jgi:uncharacterized peroxidase-related enzyme